MQHLQHCLARITNDTGETCGAGFVLSKTQVLTCAHVVRLALGGDPDDGVKTPRTSDLDLWISLPFVKPTPTRRAGRTVDLDEFGTSDVAVIEFAEQLPVD